MDWRAGAREERGGDGCLHVEPRSRGLTAAGAPRAEVCSRERKALTGESASPDPAEDEERVGRLQKVACERMAKRRLRRYRVWSVMLNKPLEIKTVLLESNETAVICRNERPLRR